jgi:glycosyltransferase involved in cell wall biosynthesis
VHGEHHTGASGRLPRVIVGIDARAAAEVPAGRGRVVRELLPALDALDTAHRFLLFCREPWEEVDLGPRFRWVTVPLPDPLWHAATAVRASRSCDVFFSTNSYLTAWGLLIPSAVLVHDLIAFVPSARAQTRAARIERATASLAIRRAARLVCNSRSTETDLVRFFPRAAGKTAVLPFAANGRFHKPPVGSELAELTRRYGVEPGAYVLASGTLEPRKNLVRLIHAHARLPQALRRQHPLLIVGPRGWEEEELVRMAAGAPEVLLAGYVPDPDLAGLYAGCSVFCYPSLYEGFGLPVLEAMAAGAAVVTSNVSSLPEVGGDAVAYVSPEDEDSIEAVLERLLSSPEERAELSERGRARAAEYSWERTARQALEELERARDTRAGRE